MQQGIPIDTQNYDAIFVESLEEFLTRVTLRNAFTVPFDRTKITVKGYLELGHNRKFIASECVKDGNLSTLVLLEEWSLFDDDPVFKTFLMTSAVRLGHLNIAKWLREKGAGVVPSQLSIAKSQGNTERLP